MTPGIERILNKNEKILWSGQPDLHAIKQTRYSGGGFINKLIAVVFIAAFIWVMNTGEAVWHTGPVMIWVWVMVAATTLWMIYKRLYYNKIKLKQWVESLIYVITDQRILILRGGEIDQTPDLSDVLHTQLISRKGSLGFSDLIWEKRAINVGSGDHRRYVSPLEREQAEDGFKALPDATAVKHILDKWIKQQQSIIQKQDSESIKQSQTPVSGDTGESIVSRLDEYVSPRYGFSMGFPASWEISSRYRKLAFGKWGIEREAIWSIPGSKPAWNVIRGQNQTNTFVEIQVQKVAAFNTLESLMGTSKVATALGNGEIIDHKASISVNGIPGFYVTRHSGTGASILPSQIEEILSNWYMRQYVLHDGNYQYYIQAMWPADHQGQQEVCEAIVETLKPC